MRKYLIIAGTVIWLAVILTGIFLVINRTSMGSSDDIAVWMPSEPETTAASETEGLPSEPEPTAGTEAQAESTMETTAPPEETTAATEAEKSNTASEFLACEMAADALDALRYWLYIPSNPTENMPLIVYLHGGSGKGDDLTLLTSVDGFPQYLQSGMLGDVRAYVVMPQLPSGQKGWADISDSLYSLIAYITSEYSIDAGNVSLTGHSMGGTGTWSLAFTYPALFARIAPLSGSIRNTSDALAKLKDTPVWAFVGSADTIVPPESSEKVVAAMRGSDANGRITVFEGADHFTVPSLAYLDSEIDLIGWLTGQTG